MIVKNYNYMYYVHILRLDVVFVEMSTRGDAIIGLGMMTINLEFITLSI